MFQTNAIVWFYIILIIVEPYTMQAGFCLE